MIEHRYIVRTVDGKKYTYECGNRQLDSVYRGIMSLDYIGATRWSKDKNVIINTKHIVSIEKW
ncbi:hypothetical protein vBSscSF1_114 [Staphylococcus phage vB-SscS-F1]|nr:hypothetical protein vBApySJF1_114 [Arcanobacterium phage vB-ApyS-JF1]